MKEITVTIENFRIGVLQSDKPVLVGFFENSAVRTEMQGAVMAAFAERHNDVRVGKVNVDQQQAIAASFCVTNIPALICLRDGKPVDQLIHGMHDTTRHRKSHTARKV